MIENGTRVFVYNRHGVGVTEGTVVGHREVNYGGISAPDGLGAGAPLEYEVNVDDKFYAPENGVTHWFNASCVGEADMVDM